MATVKGFFSKLKNNFNYYVHFRKAVFFISGLIFGHSLVQHAVLAILIIYLTENWTERNLAKAVIIINAQDGLSSLLMVFEAHLAHAFFNRFNVIVFSTLSFIGGLMMLWGLDPARNLGIYWGAAILIGLGEAGREPTLKAFLADQLKNTDLVPDQLKKGDPEADELKISGTVADQMKNNETASDELKKDEIAADELKKNVTAADQLKRDETYKKSADEECLEARVDVWWHLFRFIGILGATFGLQTITWGSTFLICAIVMGVSLGIFMYGYQFYHHEKPEGSPISTVLEVLRGAFKNRGVKYSEKSSDYFENDGGKVPLSPNIPFSRWVDKAALTEEKPSLSAKEEAKKVEPCTAAQVKEVKLLLRMVPMWGTFIVYCITQATGSTLFFEQTTNLNDRIGKYKVPVVSFYLMQKFSSYGIMYLSNKVIDNWFSSPGERKLVAFKVRVGLGMACSCLACVTARFVEIKRLKKYEKNDFLDMEAEIIKMSIFWLTPQFCLLGLMEGLTEDGLVNFFYCQVPKTVWSYGPTFNEFALGFGQFFSIFWVLTFNSWFGATINDSQLDKYYGVLAIVSFGNLFVVYVFVSIFVYKDAKGGKLDDSVEGLIVEGVEKVGGVMVIP